MPTISVIVPVYKVEAYLDRCVQSILAQTFSDFELILVDDGSPDNCPALCDEWAKKDPRIRVIHQKNGGLSAARNAGTAVAQGEYISYVDSDDYVHPQMLQALHTAVTSYRLQVASCGYAETSGEPLPTSDFPVTIWTPEEYFRQYTTNATVAWGKLYHKSVVLPYPAGKLHEDEYVTYRILFAQKQIAVVDAPMYAYFQNKTGITGSAWNPKRLDLFPAIEQQIDFFLSNSYPDLAIGRINVHEWLIRTHMEKAMQHPDRHVRHQAIRICRSRLRFHLHAYKAYKNYNMLDHLPLYDRAFPALKPLNHLLVWLWRCGSRIKHFLLR